MSCIASSLDSLSSKAASSPSTTAVESLPVPTELKARKNRKSSTGFDKSGSGGNVMTWYVETDDGEPVGNDTVDGLRALARLIWNELEKRGIAPATWAKAGLAAHNYHEHHMCQRYPELSYGENNWKAHQVATDNYSLWYGKYISRTLKIKEESIKLEPKREPSREPSASTMTSTKKRQAPLVELASAPQAKRAKQGGEERENGVDVEVIARPSVPIVVRTALISYVLHLLIIRLHFKLKNSLSLIFSDPNVAAKLRAPPSTVTSTTSTVISTPTELPNCATSTSSMTTLLATNNTRNAETAPSPDTTTPGSGATPHNTTSRDGSTAASNEMHEMGSGADLKDPASKTTTVKASKKAKAGQAMNGKSLCKREWIVENSQGTEDEFMTYWTVLGSTGQQVALTNLSFLTIASAQQIDTLTTETHHKLPRYKSTNTSGSTNCYASQTWDKTLCPDGATCTTNYALDGVDYSGVYGVTSSDALTLKFITNGANTNVGSRLGLLNSESSTSSSSTFDVDVSNLPYEFNDVPYEFNDVPYEFNDVPYEFNDVLYYSEMDADGGVAKHSTNKAGAKSSTDSNSGTGNYGACCNENDIWLPTLPIPTPPPASSAALAPPAVTTFDRYGTICDPDGCDFNSYRQGDKTFCGPRLKADTTKEFTVVTQFISSSGTANVDLTEIRRLYVQNGVIIQNSKTIIPGLDSYDSITSAYCDAQKTAFGDTKQFQAKGGLTTMGKAAKNGMVLVLSVWDDHAVNMLWLDSTYPTDASTSTPGVGRGTCATTSGTPTDVETNSPNSSVTYSNIRFGEIGSTYTGGTTASNTSSTTEGSAPASTATQVK
ncbi:hypothetical protein DXG01_016920 [Tephrocybe rancida]|nr:hypothetical protein DXG01_016920 [Tephrocybe rancida]